MRIDLVVPSGCFGSAVASVIEILRVADSVRTEVDPSIPPFDLRIAARTKRVETTTSMTLAADSSLSEIGSADLVVVPALGTLTATDTVAALAGRGGRAVVDALRCLDPGTTRVAAACTGVFALAETGVIDGRRATTSWFLGPAFRKRYPGVDLDLDAMVVSEPGIMTAGAAFAHIDLALAIIRSVSPELARRVATLLLIDERPSQAVFIAYEHLEHDDPVVAAFERHVRGRLNEPFDTTEVARSIGTSRRTLERRMRAALNLSPLAFVQRLRLERAHHLVATTDLSTADVAMRVGYANAETLRALIRRERAETGAARSLS